MQVDLRRWFCYADQSVAFDVYERLKQLPLAGPGLIELRKGHSPTNCWWIVFTNIVFGGGYQLGDVFGLPKPDAAYCWFSHYDRSGLDDRQNTSDQIQSFLPEPTLEALQLAAAKMGNEYYSTQPEVRCRTEAERRMRALAGPADVGVMPPDAPAQAVDLSALPPDVAEKVRKLLDGSEDERHRMAFELRENPDPRTTVGLVANLHAVESKLRRWAADALGRIGGPEVVPPLIEALSSEDWEVRLMAMEALDRTSEVPAIYAIEAADPTGDWRFARSVEFIFAYGDESLRIREKNFTGTAMYERIVRVMSDRPRYDALPPDRKAPLSWWAGLLGLSAGIDPRVCLQQMEQGLPFASRLHSLPQEAAGLRYLLLLAGGDVAGARSIRENWTGVSYFGGTMSSLLCRPSVLRERCRQLLDHVGSAEPDQPSPAAELASELKAIAYHLKSA